VLLSTWLLTAFQSLRLHQGNICVLLPVISWLCRHIDWIPTDVGPSLLQVRRRGTLYQNSCVVLSTPPPCLHVYWKHFFSLSTSVDSALGAVFSALMRYINWRFTYLHAYLLWQMFLDYIKLVGVGGLHSRKAYRFGWLTTYCTFIHVT